MSNRAIQSFTYSMGNQGILIKSSADEVPITAYTNLYNAFTDRENTLTIRRGWARLGTTPGDGTSNAPNGYLKSSIASYRYARCGTEWCRGVVGGDYVSISAGLSGEPAITTIATLGIKPYVFLADGDKFIKDYGVGNATDVGLSTPVTPPAIVKGLLDKNDIIEIEDFTSGIGLWTPSSLSGAGVCTQSITGGFTPHNSKFKENAIKISVSAASSVGRTVRNMPLDLGEDDDLAIELYVKWPQDSDAAFAQQFVLKFSLNDTTFNTAYEKVLTAHPMQDALTSTTMPTATTDFAQQQMIDGVSFDYSQNQGIDLSAQNQDAYQQTVQFKPADIPVGSGAWNQIRIKKSDFIRSGISLATDSLTTWANVKAVGLELVTSKDGASSICVDNITCRKKGKITGSNISYTFTYYDINTDTDSDYADIYQVPLPGAVSDQFQVTFLDVSPPVNATHRRLYRLGGLVEQFQRVDQIDISTLVYIDNKADNELTDVLNLDNQKIPGIPRGIVAFDNRLIAWGMAGEPLNRLRFSKRNKIENFPTDFWVPVGQGNEVILRCIDYDGELYIFTSAAVFRLIGTDENSYRVISTQINIGLVSILGLAKSVTSLYMVAQDGIYEFPSGKRISEAVNPIFRQQTANGTLPVLIDQLKYVTLAYYNQKLYFSYKENASSQSNDQTIVYDLGYERWHMYGYGVREFYSEPADTSINKVAKILGGVFEGLPSANAGPYIHELEVGTVDWNSTGPHGILWGVLTKELDMGASDSEKQFIDLVIDVDAANCNVDVGYAIDSPFLDVQTPTITHLGRVLANRDGRVQYTFPFPDVDGASIYGRRIIIEVKGTSAIDSTNDTQTKLFKLIPRFLIEPPKHKSYITDWSDEGNSNDKIWREMHIEYNSYGNIPHIHLEIDGVDVYSFYGTASSFRKKFYYSFPVTADMIGTKARLRIDMGDESQGGDVAGYIKVYDYAILSIPVSNPVTTFETAWSDEGAPNVFKRFRKIAVEVDNISGGTITVTPEIDGISQASFNITENGRHETVYSFPIDTTGYLWRLTVNTTTAMRFYSAKIEALPDPTHGTTYESAWGVEGSANRKRFRDILLDINTQGVDVVVTPWIDGVSIAPFTVNTPTRKSIVHALPVDTTGILARITTSGGSFHTVYNHSFTFSEEPHFSTVKETLWSDEAWPYDKLWKHVLFDVDTRGQTVTAYFWLDGVIKASWSVTTASRALLTHSLGQDVIGKLARITISGNDTQLFGAKYSFDQEPPDVTVADSYEQTFGYDGWKLLKRIYCAIKAPSTVTIKVYADEVLKDTVTVQSSLGTGYSKVRKDLNSTIKGKLYRFVFTSDTSFKLYWEKSQVEMKGLNKDDGWGLYKFNPPQTY